MTTKLPSNTRPGTTVPESSEKFNPTLHQWLIEHIETTGLTRSDIGLRLGYRDGSTVSRYVSKTPAGDIAKFEARLTDYKHRTETLRNSTSDGEIWETSVLKQSHHFCEIVRSSLDVGILHGNAGIGKSTALRAFAQENLTVLYVETNASQAGARGMTNILLKCLSDNGLGPSQSRWEYIINALEGSDRLITVDNAQRLNKEGRDFLFDLHDATRCPIVLAGNPSIKTSVAKNDQQHSRCLLQHEVSLKAKEIPNLAQKLTQKHFPNCPQVWPYAEQVAAQEGYLRALEKVLKTAVVFSELDGLSDPVQAFKAAHAKSTRNYKLID